ncbi:MAG: DUF4175 family protein, partial [Planctomycetes bacterium]|nr:DUF4175 family protein [Planctomycetota bacterium]
MTTAIHGGAVPDAIVRKLAELIRRARMVIVLRGVMATLAAATAAILAVMAIDWWIVIFSDWLRWTLSMGGLALTAAVAAWFIVRPLARSFTMTGVARLIESRHPELHERISSTVELLTSRDSPELRGSDALIAALASEAVLDARTVRPAREVSFKAAVPYLVAAGVVVAVLLAIAAIWPQQANRLLRRALLANVSRVSHTALRITRISAPELIEWHREGADYVMPSGQRLRIELTVADEAVTSAELRLSPIAGGEETASDMARLPDEPDGKRRFVITCPPATGSFRFRIHAGDALTRYYRIRVVEPPAVKRIEVRYEYPPYTRRAARLARTGGDIAAVAGTTATVTAEMNKSAASAELLIDGNSRPVEVSTAPAGRAACTFAVKLRKGTKTRWSLRLKDRYGFVNEPFEHRLRALPDRRPRVDVIVPNTPHLKLKPTDRLPIAYRLKDDFGLASAALLVEIDGRAEMPRELPISPAGERPATTAEGQTLLDLAALPLTGARQVTFRLRATDILPPQLDGPQEGFSEQFTIQLDAKAPSFAEQVALAEELQLRETLQKVLKDLQEAKKDSEPLRRILLKAPAVTEAIAARIDRVRKHLAAADAMVRNGIDKAAGGIYEGFIEKLKTLVNDHIGKALDLAGQVKLTDRKKTRSALADETDFQVDRSIALVKQLLAELGVLTDELTRTLEFQELAARQEELTDALEQMKNLDANAGEPPQDAEALEPMSPQDWRKAQEELANRLAEIARKTPGALERQLARDAQQTRDLAAEARKLARSQKDLRRETTQAAKTDQADQALRQLAARQKDLARQAAALKPAADQAKTMAQAAEDIRSADLQQALARQAAAESRLAQRAKEGERSQALERLAQQAEQLAKQQEDLSAKARVAAEADKAARAKSQSAKTPQQAGAASQSQQQARQAVRNLAGRQDALARSAERLAAQAAKASSAAKAAAGKHNPSPAMKRAAKDFSAGRADQAAEQAAQAADQARQLANALKQAAERTPRATRNASPQLADLARRQAALRQETRRLLAKKKQQTDKWRQAELDRLRLQQAQLASEAGLLADA